MVVRLQPAAAAAAATGGGTVEAEERDHLTSVLNKQTVGGGSTAPLRLLRLEKISLFVVCGVQELDADLNLVHAGFAVSVV
jgi:hypothetical protein